MSTTRFRRPSAMLVSIDGVIPTRSPGRRSDRCAASSASWPTHARLRVRINTVLGSGPAIPLAEYREDIRRAFHAPRPCASRCPVAYAHQASRVDALRPQ